MASNFQIQKPYVLTSLPRLLDPSTGRYTVGEVYGTAEGSKKRKRSEVTVGIDGEGVNIYDVSSARLITSYPVSPRSSFTCAPCSARRRRKVTGGNEAARYTYVSIRDPAPKITLFKDLVDPTGKTTSSTKSYSLTGTQSVIYLASRSTSEVRPGSDERSTKEELLVVQQDGEIIGLDGESLDQKWKTSSATLHQDLGAEPRTDFHVEFCTLALTSEVTRGIFKGNQDWLSSVSSADQSEEDPELLLLISRATVDGQDIRHLHVLGSIPSSRAPLSSSRGLIQLHVVPIVIPTGPKEPEVSFRLDIRSGHLFELCGETLRVYDLTASIPKTIHTMEIEDAVSFLRLSKNSILASTPTLLSVYNPQFQSLQSSTAIDLEAHSHDAESGSKRISRCSLVAYFSRLELAVGVSDSNLIAVQLEAPRIGTKKRRTAGLLIDSVGRGIHQSKRATAGSRASTTKTAFSDYLPGSILADYWDTWQREQQQADSFLESNQLEQFESLLASKFGVEVEPKVANGVDETNGNGAQKLPEWKWPEHVSEYPRVDRRWILYAINSAFRWQKEHQQDDTVPQLICSLPYTNVINYLVHAGHLTISNIKSALREELQELEDPASVLAEQLIARLADLDPTMELLTMYISSTTLGSIELLLAIRALMRSLELVRESNQPPPKLLTNGQNTSQQSNGQPDTAEDGMIGMELDQLEEEIQKTESYLNGNTDIRAIGLRAAFAKLGNRPAISMVKALRSTFKPEEVLSLVYLLRIELVKGAWTARYLDDTDYEQDPDLVAPPDGIIKLIADLLGRCVDSIGPSGWLFNDASLAGDESADFIASLKLEVSAALEGLEEAVYLQGIVGEAVKYCNAAQKKATAAANNKVNLAKPIPLQVKEPGAEALPLGLKIKSSVAKEKVVSGGEVVQRSLRETGYLRSQQVGPYSLERIAI